MSLHSDMGTFRLQYAEKTSQATLQLDDERVFLEPRYFGDFLKRQFVEVPKPYQFPTSLVQSGQGLSHRKYALSADQQIFRIVKASATSGCGVDFHRLHKRINRKFRPAGSTLQSRSLSQPSDADAHRNLVHESAKLRAKLEAFERLDNRLKNILRDIFRFGRSESPPSPCHHGGNRAVICIKELIPRFSVASQAERHEASFIGVQIFSHFPPLSWGHRRRKARNKPVKGLQRVSLQAR